jgi:hypothetical protein
MAIAPLIATALGCGGESGMEDDVGVSTNRAKTAVTMLNERDPEAVYRWAFAECQINTLEVLNGHYGTDGIPEAVGRRFPPETAEMAVNGCRAGFAARRKRAPRP